MVNFHLFHGGNELIMSCYGGFINVYRYITSHCFTATTPFLILDMEAADICMFCAVICCQGQGWCQLPDLWGFPSARSIIAFTCFPKAIISLPLSLISFIKCPFYTNNFMSAHRARKQSGVCFPCNDCSMSGSISTLLGSFLPWLFELEMEVRCTQRSWSPARLLNQKV